MPTTTRRRSSFSPLASAMTSISRSTACCGSPPSSAAKASLAPGTSSRSSRIRAARPSAAKSPCALASVSRAPSISPAWRWMIASCTLASARAGSSSMARRSDASSPAATRLSASLGTSASKNRATAAGGWTPTNSDTSLPSLNALTAGMPWIWNACAMRGLASVSSLARTTWPSRSAAACSRIGPSARHGPHHSAQKSTTTGVVLDCSMTCCWKSCSVTSMTAMVCKGTRGEAVPRAQRRGPAGRPPARPHRHPPLRRHGVQVAATGGPRRADLRRARPRASDPAPSPEAYTYEDLAGDLVEVLDDAGLERAVLAGASMGAHTALRLALDHPERVAGLVVVTPAYDPESWPGDLARWDALSDGLRQGGVDGFVAAYGDGPGGATPEKWKDALQTVLRQRLAAHEHPGAVADALKAVPRSRPFASRDDLRAIAAPTVVVADRDEPDPGHPLAVGELYASLIPGARLVVEEEGNSPIAWQGGQLSKVIAEVAAQAFGS